MTFLAASCQTWPVRAFALSPTTRKCKPQLAQPGRSPCRPEPAKQAKNLTSAACNLSPATCPASILWTRTQRPKGLMLP